MERKTGKITKMGNKPYPHSEITYSGGKIKFFFDERDQDYSDLAKDDDVTFEIDQRGNKAIKLQRVFPNPTKALIDKIPPSRVENTWLRLNRWIPWETKDGKLAPKGYESTLEGGGVTAKTNKGLIARQEVYINSISKAMGSGKFTVKRALALGLGDSDVQENSLSLDFIYGLPHIGGQQVKGMLSSWLRSEFFHDMRWCHETKQFVTNEYPDENAKITKAHWREYSAYMDPLFCLLFGCPERIALPTNDKVEHDTALGGRQQKGLLVFSDMLPANDVKIRPEVLTVHYKPYYEDTTNAKPPADYYNPVPVFFPVVDKGAVFQLSVGLLSSYDWTSLPESPIWNVETPLNDLEIIKFILDQIQEMLDVVGAGAKTSRGFGKMA